MTSITRSLALGASGLALGGAAAATEGPDCSDARLTVGTMTPPFIGGPAIGPGRN